RVGVGSGEDRRAVGGGRVRGGLVKGDAGEGRPASVAARVAHHTTAVVIGVVRCRDRPRRVVEAGTQVQAGPLVAGLRPVPLVAGPAEVARGAAGRGSQTVDLLPGIPPPPPLPYLLLSPPPFHPDHH